MSRIKIALISSGLLLATAAPVFASGGPVWFGPSFRHTPEWVVTPLKDMIITSSPGNGALSDTYNHASLTSDYVSHVTAWDPYFNSSPTHTVTFSGFEWFGNAGDTSASVKFYVQAAPGRQLNAFALWNEESSGIGSFNLFGPDGTLLIARTSPTDNTLATNTYTSEQWGGARQPDGWYTLEMTGCPQPLPGTFAACAIGEVAWGETTIPEPASWALMIAGFGLVGYSMRRRRLQHVSA
ncbi:MAG: PEPxxWA-CTERM sorting domain-containing protein [Polymorphobacter sp.]